MRKFSSSLIPGFLPGFLPGFVAASVALLAVAGALVGCEKSNKAPGGNQAAQAPSGLPAGGAGAPADPRGGMPMGTGANPHGGGDPHAGMDMGGGAGANPHGAGGMQGTMPAPGPIDPASVIEGTIEASAALAGKVKPGDVVFLSLKAVDPATGEIRRGPLAVDRIEIKQLPQAFTLSNQNQMMAGTKIEGQVAVTVRIDRDADAMTRAAGDLEGIVKTTPPQKGLKVVIDTEVQ